MPITLWHSLGGPPGTVLQQIVQDYNTTHQDNPAELIFVNPQDYASSARNALNSLRISSQDRSFVPDIVFAPEYMTGDMLQAEKEGYVVSVGDCLSDQKKADIADIVARTFGPHCLPFNPSCGVLYINASLLEQIQISADWKPSSLEELASVSQKLREANLVESGFTCAWPESYLVEAVLAQQNLPLLTTDGKYNFSQLDKHLFNLWKLVQEGVFLPPQTGNYDVTRDLFLNRKVAFYMQGSGHHSLIGSKAEFKMGCAPLPTLSMGQRVKYTFPLGGSAIWVLNAGSSKQGMISNVRAFLDYFSSQEVQERWHQETAYVPVNRNTPSNLQEFYKSNPLHKAVVDQTILAPVGENSYGIKKEGYREVRIKLYPLIRELLTLKGTNDEVALEIRTRLESFDAECNLGS